MDGKRLLTFLVGIGLLAACTGNGEQTQLPSPAPTTHLPSPIPTARPPEGGRVTITFACPDYQRKDFVALVEGFEEANPDIRVQFVPGDEAAGIQRQGDTVASTGNPWENLAAAADTFIWHASFHRGGRSLLLDLQPFVDDPSFPTDDFFPGTLDHFRWRGGIYGLPAYVSPLMVFYDRGMFDEAKLPYPSIGWTWDDFEAAASQLTVRDGDKVSRYGFVDQWWSSTILAMMKQEGVPLWDDGTDPPRPLFDSPEVATALRRYTDMALRDKVMPVPEIESPEMAFNLIDGGQAAMWTTFAFDRDYYAEQTNLGLVPFPEGKAASNPRDVYGLFISAGTAQPEAAWRWLSYLSANYQLSHDGYLPGRRSVAEQLPWWRQLDEETKAVYEYVMAHPTPDNYLERQPLLFAAALVFSDSISIEEALMRAQGVAAKLQIELAEAIPPTPQPVATPQPGPEAGQTVIRFAPAPGEDQSRYRTLATSFHQNHLDVSVEIVSVSLTSLEDLARSADCFGLIGSLATFPEGRQSIRALGPLVDADPSFDPADYYPQFLEPFQQGGELWGLPYDADAWMVYLNLDRFTAAGVTPPQPGWTMQNFLNTAGALSNGSHHGFTTREGAYGDLVFVLERLGAHLYDDSHDPPTPTFDDPTVVAALGQYASLYRGRALTPATPAQASGWPDGTVTGAHPAGVPTGEVAMWVDSISSHAYAPTLPFQVGVLPLPVGATASTEFEVWAFYISAHTTAPQACWEWLTFLSAQPEIVQMLPTRRSIANSPLWQGGAGVAALPAYQATLSYVDTPIFRLRMEIPWLGYAYPWLYQAFEAVVGGQEAQAALGEAQAKAEALLACLEAGGGFDDRAQVRACAQRVDSAYPLSGANP